VILFAFERTSGRAEVGDGAVAARQAVTKQERFILEPLEKKRTPLGLLR
jgi:hypothetical protein